MSRGTCPRDSLELYHLFSAIEKKGGTGESEEVRKDPNPVHNMKMTV